MKFSDLNTIECSNKTVLITGANAGLGYEVALYFASKGAQVIGCGRSITRLNQAKEKILALYPQSKIDMLVCDLSSFESIKQFAHTILSDNPTIDLLFNNAGVMAIPYATTQEGYEMQLGVNHIGHFLLTALLIPHLNPSARIINVSSMAHMNGTLDLNDPFYTIRPYHSFKAYAQSKLANLLFTHEFNERMQNSDKKIIAVSAHPGVALTSLFDKVETNSFMKWMKPLFGKIIPSAKHGAQPLIVAALHPQAQANDFYGPGSYFKKDEIKISTMSPLAKDKTLQKGLWDLSEQWIQHTIKENKPE